MAGNNSKKGGKGGNAHHQGQRDGAGKRGRSPSPKGDSREPKRHRGQSPSTSNRASHGSSRAPSTLPAGPLVRRGEYFAPLVPGIVANMRDGKAEARNATPGGGPQLNINMPQGNGGAMASLIGAHDQRGRDTVSQAIDMVEAATGCDRMLVMTTAVTNDKSEVAAIRNNPNMTLTSSGILVKGKPQSKGQHQQAHQGRSHPAEETTGRQSKATRRAELENLVQQLRIEVQGLTDQQAELETELADQKRQSDVRIAMLTDQVAQQKEKFEREISSLLSERVGHAETQNAISLPREEVRDFGQVAVEAELQGQGAVLSQGFQELSEMAADFPLVPKNQQQFRVASVACMIAPYLEGQRAEKLRDFLQQGRCGMWYCVGDVVRNGSAVQHELNPLSPNCRSHKDGNCLLILVENQDGVRRLNFLEPK